MKKDLTIKRLKNTNFPTLYKSFLLNKDMNNNTYFKMLSLATIFLNSSNDFIKQLGYRILIIYSNQTNDYKPLYEVSLNLGLIPVAKFVQERTTVTDSVFSEFNVSFMELYNHDNIYFSEQQKNLLEFYKMKKDSNIAIVAPTSYGKTELIISTLRECKNKNICIITPTKSLLAQTKIRILNSNIDWINKVVTHPEMFNENDDFTIAVLTQERLLRLLKNYPQFKFDYVLVDEAHGLLNNDERSILLASAIIILKKRNAETIFKFLTPFLCDYKNLQVKYTKFNIDIFKISEYIKTEKYYIFDKNNANNLRLYDQFLDEFYPVKVNNEIKDNIDFIKKHRARKNIIYLNKPIDIETFSKSLSFRLLVNSSSIIEEACKSISEYMHPQYSLIKYLKKGIIYHHGSVPDNIRIYIEHLFSTVKEIKYVITSSTLLEGVNLPAERMFILDNKKGRSYLSPSNFKNLVGRICRFSDIFNSQNGNLKKLEPAVYLVVGQYYSQNADVDKFLKNSAKADREIKDNPENVLLKTTEINNENTEDLNHALEFVENFENGIIDDSQIRYATTEIGKSCFKNNVNEIDIFSIEVKLDEKVNSLIKQASIIDNTERLFNILYEVFFCNVIDNQHTQNLIRFRYQETRNFYKMFLDWRIKSASYKEMIASFLIYWKQVEQKKSETLIYVGRWGDQTREGVRPFWTDIKEKSDVDKINLAIVRIKDEQDFLDNTILKFVEVLNDLALIEKSLFLKIKYGTDDEGVITLVKNGLSLSLSKLLIDKYISYLQVDVLQNTISINKKILDMMIANAENQVMLYEVQCFLSK